MDPAAGTKPETAFWANGSYNTAGWLSLWGPFLFLRNTQTMNFMQCMLIGCGGFIGALSRYFVGSWVTSRLPQSSFPWGTFVINATGSFLLGLIATLLAERVLQNANWRPFITIGFIGAYTTFSTFEYETLQLGNSLQALTNLVGSVIVGYGCVWVGSQLAHQIVMFTPRATHG